MLSLMSFSLDFHWDEWGDVAAAVWNVVNEGSGEFLNVLLIIFFSVAMILALLQMGRGSDNF